MDRIGRIRSEEAFSHKVTYENHELYDKGSWLSRPLKTVMDILPYFKKYDREIRILDLGCGVGRNAIAAARSIRCRIDCVDLLPAALKHLKSNARYYQVSSKINPILSSVDSYQIEKEKYDCILAISVLEHLGSRDTLLLKLHQIREGLTQGGVFILTMNTDIIEVTSDGVQVDPMFEINLKTEEAAKCCENMFHSGYKLIKKHSATQTYPVVRNSGTNKLTSSVLTYVFRKL
ncbi:class I SAM-dependent methyltransferase [Clostridium luticellarii]|jgi:2-polyprenyl-3-methyl-5-hydroxy-6-metoxy-1,4-benzoquinol methylase|uniref:Bifunctional 3-demethylubiquinone-9 3-methyltransferase/ 2-octaprenyl-6-hydroxy phenol methylase n=1 Tax=Clostridium luticellarii TaxID=1691940 RepID=A0A2T0B7H2_9CLOT|nr:class I SAM-dependent methyltransferase [Clostridium luticellarii]MCI1943996.1 class I SAM-dependent methyltransferase [Clostridium luticellarii]MCI1967362.1 class I SAM-dependent methyltransferase [Clostridium luticellarii]PRR79840.1 bifunctional 3-demethylubiquinone-9 3-methyltransferase/ 2-octaprenyl-6-hydroxy phenol methylase [Clostridium luticellarii]